jgi:hypothetical protein
MSLQEGGHLVEASGSRQPLACASCAVLLLWGNVHQRSRGTTHPRSLLLNHETNQLPWTAHPPLALPSPLIDPAVHGFSPVTNQADAFQISGLALILLSAVRQNLFTAGSLSRTGKPWTCVSRPFLSSLALNCECVPSSSSRRGFLCFN